MSNSIWWQLAMLKNFGNVVLVVTATLAISLPFVAEAKSGGPDEQGVKAYTAKDFKRAAEIFGKITASGSASAIDWLYLGHSYLGMGDRVRSMSAYRTIKQKYPASQEAVLAEQYLTRLEPTRSPTLSKVAAMPASNNGFMDRVYIIPPLNNHPPVSRTTYDAVRSAISRLPKKIYHLLDDTSTTVYLAPNIIDKWPKAGDDPKPDMPNVTLGEEPGRTYGREIYLYEREKERGTTNLKEARTTAFIVRILYQQLGHSIDDVLKQPSTDPAFRAALAADIENMSNQEKRGLAYFCVPMECFAECTGSLIGDPSGEENNSKYFPQAKAWVRRKLGI